VCSNCNQLPLNADDLIIDALRTTVCLKKQQQRHWTTTIYPSARTARLAQNIKKYIINIQNIRYFEISVLDAIFRFRTEINGVAKMKT